MCMLYCFQRLHLHDAFFRASDLIAVRRRTLTVMLGILTGKWVVSASWLPPPGSVRIANEQDHEVTSTPERGRKGTKPAADMYSSAKHAAGCHVPGKSACSIDEHPHTVVQLHALKLPRMQHLVHVCDARRFRAVLRWGG